MHVGCVLLVLMFLGTGCHAVRPETTPAAPPAGANATPATLTAAGAAPSTSRPPAKPAAPASPQPAAKAPDPARPAPAAAAAVAPAALDLTALTEQLKSTSAIGFFTKITLKNQVDDLLDDCRAFHAGTSTLTKTGLRHSFDLLLMKVLSLVQDKDPTLASAIVFSREPLWQLLADPKRFATLPI